MHAAVTIIQAMLIMIIAVSITAMSIPWTLEKIQDSMDVAEMGSIKQQFDSCNEMIIETARTGSTNKCVFTVSRGRITGTVEGINYGLISSADMCDQSGWVQIDEKRHIWQKCDISGDKWIFNMRWKFPSQLEVRGQQVVGNQLRGESSIAKINFTDPIDFTTITLYIAFEYREGETGNIVEISRVNVTATNITLNIKIS